MQSLHAAPPDVLLVSSIPDSTTPARAKRTTKLPAKLLDDELSVTSSSRHQSKVSIAMHVSSVNLT
jgi:hypothetical protein